MTSALSSAELDAIRADVATLLPDTCNILAKTLASDGSGGMTETWAASASNVACRIDPARGREIAIGEKMEPFYGFILTLPHGTTITAQNRVSVNSQAFAVVSVDTGKSWSASVRAYVERE